MKGKEAGSGFVTPASRRPMVKVDSIQPAGGTPALQTVVFALILSLGMVSAETWTVHGGSIQSAIHSSKAGDTIRVYPGAYSEDLTLDRQLTLEGIGKPLLHGSGKGSVITVTADGCAIRGFVIEHSGGELQQEHSGILLKSNHNIVEENELHDILFGIYCFASGNNIIRRNVIRGRPELEVGDRGAGLHLWTSPANRIEENEVSVTRDGLFIQNSNDNWIRHNRIHDLRYGVHYMFSDANHFEENVFSNSVAGAAIMYSRRIEFRRNVFLHNRGFSSFGILLQECVECVAEENFIMDNGTGIFLEALKKSVVRRNVIAGNDVALQIFGSSAENVFSENNFLDNLSPLQLVGNSSGSAWQENGRGNFWNDTRIYDLDGNGIGDVPYRIQNVFEYMEGNHPRLRLYLYSPAAQALAQAEETFPLVRGSQEVDPAPLVKAVETGLVPAIEPRRGVQAGLGMISLALFAGSLAFLWRGQR